MNMTDKTIPTPYAFARNYAFLAAAIPILYNIALVLLNLLPEYYGDDPGGAMKQRTLIFIIPLVVVWAIYKYRRLNQDRLQLKTALIIGLEIGLLTGIVLIVHHYLFNSILAPDFHLSYYEEYGEQVYEELKACCDYTSEQYEHHKRQRTEYGAGGRGYLGDVVFATIIGGLFAMVAGLFLRK